MSQYPRYTLNRHLVLLAPKQPVLDWLRATDPLFDAETTLEELRSDDDVFLLPEDAGASFEQAVEWVEQRWQVFFEHYLDAWTNDESVWPNNISLELFREWFSIEYHSTVWDLAGTPFLLEDWEDDEDEDKDEEDEDEEQPKVLH